MESFRFQGGMNPHAAQEDHTLPLVATLQVGFVWSDICIPCAVVFFWRFLVEVGSASCPFFVERF